MGKQKPCIWNCGRLTDRHCRICLDCCNARDEVNKRIDAGLEAYVPPDKRPGHRFYKPEGRGKRALTEKQRAAMASRKAKLRTEIDFKAPQSVDER